MSSTRAFYAMFGLVVFTNTTWTDVAGLVRHVVQADSIWHEPNIDDFGILRVGFTGEKKVHIRDKKIRL